MRSALDWWFRDRDSGRIVVAQAPNLPMWIVIVAAAVRWLLSPSGTASTVLDVVFAGALTWWAVDELARGVNPWRRLLGGTVLAVLGSRLLR